MKKLIILIIFLGSIKSYSQGTESHPNYQALDSLHYKVWWVDYKGKKHVIKDSVIIQGNEKFLYKTGVQVGFIPTPVQSNEQGRSIILIHAGSYENVPEVIKRSDGRWIVVGDSMSAIKMLWREIERRDSVNNAEKVVLFKAIADLQKAHKEYVKGVQSILKP